MHNKILYLYIIMQTNKKTIKITPGLFNTNKKTKKKKKKPNVRVNTKTRNELIRKLKKKQNKLRKNSINRNNNKKEKPSKKTIITSALDDSFKVLEELYNKHKKKRDERKRLKKQKNNNQQGNMMQINNSNTTQHYNPNIIRHNKTIKRPNENNNIIDVYTELPSKLKDVNIPKYNTIKEPVVQPIILKPNPPYGCLKNGNKPTYRSWQTNKTMKNNKIYTPNLQQNISNREMILNKIKLKIKEQREKIQREKLEKLKQTSLNDSTNVANNIINKKLKKIKKHIRTLKRKIRKKTYKLGKKDKKVSVLIKNNKTRKKIQQEQILLRKKKIHDIKSELIESGLLKYGSTAPNYILRSLYENAILSGEVKNTSDAILLHNYMSKK